MIDVRSRASWSPLHRRRARRSSRSARSISTSSRASPNTCGSVRAARRSCAGVTSSIPITRAYLALREGECIAHGRRVPPSVSRRRALDPGGGFVRLVQPARPARLGSRRALAAAHDEGPRAGDRDRRHRRHARSAAAHALPDSRQRGALRHVARRGARGGADRRAHAPAAPARPARVPAEPAAARAARARAPAGGRVEAVAKLGEEALAIDPRPGGRGSAPIWTPEYLAWLAGRRRRWAATCRSSSASGGALVGWALLRSYDSGGGRDAALLDVRAREPGDALYTWMVSEIAVRARAEGCGLLTAGTSCPHVAAGLRANRFHAFTPAPIHYCVARRGSARGAGRVRRALGRRADPALPDG